MTTPAYSELIAAIRGEGEGILAAGRMGCEPEVPTCPGWDVERLLRHVCRVYTTAEFIVSHRITQEPEEFPSVPEGDPLYVLESLLDDLVTALRDADEDTPMWNWSDLTEPPTAAFWARRMAHESSVHRFDAQIAHAMPQPIDAELAADGLDELIDVLSPRIYRRAETDGPQGTVQLLSSDDRSWCLALEPRAVQRLDVITEPDATARGTSSTLLLAAYGRAPWTSLTVDGDLDLLERWSSVLNF
jgi:uncharacterized protein (TIGR03083 family)